MLPRWGITIHETLSKLKKAKKTYNVIDTNSYAFST